MLIKDNFMELSTAELNKKPAPKKWSIAQCIDHIIKIDRLYIQQIQKALDNQDIESEGQMYHPSLTGRFFINMMKPGGKMKMKTFKAFKPREAHINKSILEEFEQHQSELMELVIMSNGKNLNRIKVTSPISSLLKFRLGDVFSMLAFHQRRHINQALRAKDFTISDE